MADEKTVDVDEQLVAMLHQTQEIIVLREVSLSRLVDERRANLAKLDEQRKKTAAKFRADKETLRAEIEGLCRTRGKLCRATGITLAQVAEEPDQGEEAG